MTDETGGSLSIEVNVAAGARRLPGHPIELESFDIIDRILAPADPDEPVYQIARRVVHTTGDPGMAGELAVSGDAVAAALSAFAAGEQIICDVNMAAAGIKPTAAKLGLEVRCLIADRQTEELAAREGITRGAAGIRRAAAELDHDSSAANGASCLKDAVVVIGNAPTALFECLRLAEDPRTRPAVIVGVPVGFVGAAESKEALMASGLPYVTLPGNRGGSNIAVAIANALMRLSDASRSGSVDSGGAGSEEKAGAGSEEMNSCEQKEES